jgi:hypothetical protein
MALRPQEVPVLRLVPMAAVRFHEHPERHRTVRLVARLGRDTVLRNPPIVAEPEPGAYVLLDGANRVSAFRDLGYQEIPVQVIDYASTAVQLKQWHHLLLAGAALDLRGAYARIAGVRFEPVPRERIASLLEQHRIYAGLVDEKGQVFGLFPASGQDFGLPEWMRVLDEVVSAYEGKAQLERIKWADYTDLPPVYTALEHQLVLFPVIGKQELLQIVRDGLVIPTGITRHVVPGRALALNLDLEFLHRLPTFEERSAWFDAFFEKLEVEGRIRYYEESVFLLNE